MTEDQEAEYRAAAAARYLRISTATLKRWGDKGYLRFRTLPSGHRRYTQTELDAIADTPPQETP